MPKKFRHLDTFTINDKEEYGGKHTLESGMRSGAMRKHNFFHNFGLPKVPYMSPKLNTRIKLVATLKEKN